MCDCQYLLVNSVLFSSKRGHSQGSCIYQWYTKKLLIVHHVNFFYSPTTNTFWAIGDEISIGSCDRIVVALWSLVIPVISSRIQSNSRIFIANTVWTHLQRLTTLWFFQHIYLYHYSLTITGANSNECEFINHNLALPVRFYQCQQMRITGT